VPRNNAQTVRSRSLGISGLALLMRPAIWLLHCLLGRPRDSALAILVASAVGAIVINGLFLQHGRHPAPIFAQLEQLPAPVQPREVPVRRVGDAQQIAPTLRSDEPTGAVIAALPRERPPEAPPKVQQASPRTVPARKDAIGDLLAPTQQLTAIQRTLSDYGYGQIAPNGVMGSETRAAIERFERDRHLPVTGQISERLVRELTAMTGRPL
jgi:hypothetical protein